ncbi:bifunctional alpha/beta hydrolase/OsmC family protein [Eudoraea chungangensis]|uniref:bifunctional alpha/beta hydrolase/OsmC family protein n=1 Tax=Eudoraea chungangensis TaxID=1481905 RepID=UPI0023EB4717|nr:bifunctional alpha/beta hydrolase/OsmC family protein [Eudoraea chungangensis]
MGNLAIKFRNREGELLSGKLDLPADQHPHNYVLFAHCFTCNKNLLAISNISRSLISKGFGVFRFDFTGLGESEGDFEDSNFSGNVEDLVAASQYLSENYASPSLLIGHSLGGAAVLAAAPKIPSVKAVATIGAPSNPNHVQHLFKSDLEEIKKNGLAKVNIGGRDFTIKKQFLEDLKASSTQDIVDKNNVALLFMHSPQDSIVGIKNAEELYIAAHHPKSFVTLDGADHLLTNKSDSLYVGNVIGSWVEKYIPLPKPANLKSKYQVVAKLSNNDGFTTDLKMGQHYLTADEPVNYGGNDFGPSPYELVSAGLSACTAMTMQMYAKRKNWDLKEVEVHTSYGKDHAVDCEKCESNSSKIDTFQRLIKMTGNLDLKQKERLLEIADKCPVHRTLHSETQVITNNINA